MQFAKRIEPLRSNVYADMDNAKARARAAGMDIIDLSLGSSDLPAASHVTDTIARSLDDPSTHGYTLFHSTKEFRDTIAQWYTQKYGVGVDPETEIMPLIGCQEGTGHLPLALLNPGDYALLQDPGYPSHYGGVYLASGRVYTMPTLEENQFLPVLEDIPQEILSQAKMIVLSYPHNPTTGIAPLSFFEKAVRFCQENDLALIHDFPYADMGFGEVEIPSILQADREKSISIEFFTMSKSYNMGGFRVAYAIGNRELILALRQIKAAIDFNQYRGIINGAIAALTGSQDIIPKTVNTFRQRRDVFVDAMHRIGWPVPKPAATMYVWAKLPERWQNDSMGFTTKMVEKVGVAAAAGSGYGPSGEGYVRFALVQNTEILEEAVRRIERFLQIA